MSIGGQAAGDHLIYCHLYGTIGDWYISEISENKEIAFGYKIINSEPAWEMDEWIKNCNEWGEICIKTLQELVNQKFVKDKDIRFLIARDLLWKPIKFSKINTDQNTLLYPGKSDRNTF